MNIRRGLRLRRKTSKLVAIACVGLVGILWPCGIQARALEAGIGCLSDPVVKRLLAKRNSEPPHFESLFYVDASATGAGTGESWAAAFVYLQDALLVAGAGDQIWVAEGVYRPDQGAGQTAGDQNATFSLQAKIAMYGGFPTGGGQWETRDVQQYQTHLSGDLRQNDKPGFWFHGDNSYHVVTAIATDANTILDGFYITGGSATGEDEEQQCGGGCLVTEGCLVLCNCLFQGNRAHKGGGIYLQNASPLIGNCVFTENYGVLQAGAIENHGSSSPVIVNCCFRDNAAYTYGGALENASSLAGPTLINCLFSKNRADYGGAMANHGSSRPLVWNCTFYGNHGRQAGGGLWNSQYVTSPTIINSILWNNTDTSGQVVAAQVSGGTSDIRYSCVQGWKPEQDVMGNICGAPHFVDPEAGDFQLRSLYGRWDSAQAQWVHDWVTSPCIDGGIPAGDWILEPWPHGMRLNMGSCGGTPIASLSGYCQEGAGDFNRDRFVDMLDVTLIGQQWLARDALLEQDLDRNGIVNFVDFALQAEQWDWVGVTSSVALDLARPVHAESVAAFAELRDILDWRYSYRDIRKVDWEEYYALHEPLLHGAPDARAFAERAAEMLLAVQDPHLRLRHQMVEFERFCPSVDTNYDFTALRYQIPNWKDRNDRISVGCFEDGIYYVLVRDWNAQSKQSLKPLFDVLMPAQGSPGLIIDVRSNQGGSEDLAAQVAGCFVTEEKVYAQSRQRVASALDGFGPMLPRTLLPNTTQPTFTGSVVVLTGPACLGANEFFLLMMQQADNVILMGDTSYGSPGPAHPISLSNGVAVYFPDQLMMRADGTLLEGEGVAPDISVLADSQVFAQSDPVLDQALVWLRSRSSL